MLLPVRRGRALVALAVGALCGGVLATPAHSVPSAGAEGVGDGYFPLDGNGGINVLRYRIRDRYRFATGRLSGRTTLTVRATRDLSEFNLDFLLPVSSVRVGGAPASHSRPVRHELTIAPAAPLAAGARFRVTVRYTGRPDRFGYAEEHNWLADRHEVVAMNQPHMAPWWFPANDHPSDKARMDIAITVPRGHQVFANGSRVARRRHHGLVTRRFVAKEPMATYLATFAAGRFAVRHGRFGDVRWRAVVSRQLAVDPRSDNMALMLRTARIIRSLQRDLGDYPFTRAGGLVTALPVGFALENQTMPTYPATGRYYTDLVVHEQAHQWFGDSVALRRWRDIWLNEGAATFMEVRYHERHGGMTGSEWLRDAYDRRSAGSPFWDLAIGDPGRARMFDTAVYERGAMTFQALRERIGEAHFWTLLQRWLADNANGHGTRREFESLAEEISGDRLDDFFEAWLDTDRRPADVAANGLG